MIWLGNLGPSPKGRRRPTAARMGSGHLARSAGSAREGRRSDAAIGSRGRWSAVQGRSHWRSASATSQTGARAAHASSGRSSHRAPRSRRARSKAQATQLRSGASPPKAAPQPKSAGADSSAAATSQSQTGRYALCRSRWRQRKRNWSSRPRTRICESLRGAGRERAYRPSHPASPRRANSLWFRSVSAAPPRPGPLQRGLRSLVLPGTYAEVDVAGRSQSPLRVEAGRGPALEQDGLDARRAEQREYVFDLPLLERGL